MRNPENGYMEGALARPSRRSLSDDGELMDGRLRFLLGYITSLLGYITPLLGYITKLGYLTNPSGAAGNSSPFACLSAVSPVNHYVNLRISLYVTHIHVISPVRPAP